MDSKTDVPLILAEDFAHKMAYATMAAIAQVAGLRKKAAEPQQLELPVIRKGQASNTVKAVQQLLLGMGYSLPKHGADGIFGQETELVVRAFQLASGLTVNGVIDSGEWRALLRL